MMKKPRNYGRGKCRVCGGVFRRKSPSHSTCSLAHRKIRLMQCVRVWLLQNRNRLKEYGKKYREENRALINSRAFNNRDRKNARSRELRQKNNEYFRHRDRLRNFRDRKKIAAQAKVRREKMRAAYVAAKELGLF